MNLSLLTSWPLLCIFFGALLFLSMVLRWQCTYFYTQDVVLRQFKILDLEIPASQAELINTIKGIYQLPPERFNTSVKAVKLHLYIDFIFMPFAYGFIAILCLLVSKKMSLTAGANLFVVFAFLQLFAWLFDFIENIYLLGKIKSTVTASTPAIHTAYLIIELFKWGIALVSLVCAVAAIFYFWLSGHYSIGVFPYLVICLGEIFIFSIVSKLIFKKKTSSK